MAVDQIDQFSDFVRLYDNWNEVYDNDSEAQFFLSWSWLKILFEQRDEGVFVLAYRQDDSPSYQAFFPLRKEVRFNDRKKHLYNAFTMAGNYWADYTGILCRDDSASIALPEIARYLRKLPWYRLQIENLSISDKRKQSLLKRFLRDNYDVAPYKPTDNAGQTRLDKSPRLKLPDDFDEYLSISTDTNSRQKFRRYLRKLDQDSDAQIRLSTNSTLEDDLNKFKQLWLERWSSVKGKRAALLAEKYHNLIKKGFEAGLALIHVFEYKNNIVAINCCYLDSVKRELLFFVGARNGNYSQLPSGLILHLHAIRWAISNQYSVYDFLRGDEPYKYSFGAENRHLTNLRITNPQPHEMAKLVDPVCAQQALSLVKSLEAKLSSEQTQALYGHLLDCWPTHKVLLHNYASWLERNRSTEYASDIRAALN